MMIAITVFGLVGWALAIVHWLAYRGESERAEHYVDRVDYLSRELARSWVRDRLSNKRDPQ